MRKNFCSRRLRQFASDAVVQDSGEPDPQVLDAMQHDVQDLPDEVFQFLLEAGIVRWTAS